MLIHRSFPGQVEKKKPQAVQQSQQGPPPGVRVWKGLEMMPNATQGGIAKSLGALRQAGKAFLTIAVVGKQGVGKSSTVNAMLNERVAPVSTFQPDTSRPTAYRRWSGGLLLTILDTPAAVEGDTVSSSNMGAIAEALSGIHEVDAVLYVDRLDSWRVCGRDRAAIRAFTEFFGSGFWDKAVITLTHGQLAAPPEIGFSTYAQQRAQRLQEAIRKESSNSSASLPSAVVENSGRCKTSSTSGEKVLPDDKPWVPRLFGAIAQVAHESEPLEVDSEMANEVPRHHRRGKPWIPLILAVQAFLIRPLAVRLIKSDPHVK